MTENNPYIDLIPGLADAVAAYELTGEWPGTGWEPQCAECQDTGCIHTDRGIRPCECALRNRRTIYADAFLKQAGGRYSDGYFRALDRNSGALAVLIAWWASNGPRSCYLHGGYGTGKTDAVAYLGYCACHASTPRRAEYCSCYALSAELRNWSDNESGRSAADEYMLRLCNADLLVLDDLGAEHRTQYVCVRLDELIDYRYRNGWQTVIASNLTPLQAQRVYPGRMCDRIADARWMATLQVDWKSMRRRT